MDDLITSRTGIQYSLKQALMRNPATIKSGDDISAVALARIEAQEAEIARLRDTLEHAASALNRVAWGGDFTCFVDAEWVSVNNALDAALAALGDEQ